MDDQHHSSQPVEWQTDENVPETTWKQILFALLPLITFFLLLAPSLVKNNIQEKAPVATKQIEKQGYPARLKIPSIKVDATIEYVGVTETGAMDVPQNTLNVGWFDLGPRPGEKGSAVVAGHLDGENGEHGVFKQLEKLQKGDKIIIDYREGNSLSFVVRTRRIYQPGYAAEVFGQSDGVHLNLITCDGAWDGEKESYTKRLVVFADMIN